ncbi:hypothetical protein B566_EDAN013776 [Ephemera danica]|nr:hypothetical protein B566_EDAN013776 [Ephemera danica]
MLSKEYYSSVKMSFNSFLDRTARNLTRLFNSCVPPAQHHTSMIDDMTGGTKPTSIRFAEPAAIPIQTSFPDASISPQLEEPDEMQAAQTDANPFASKKTALRRQSAVEAPRTPQVEIRSPVAHRDAEEYNMEHPRRGVALILNHMQFHHEEYRAGSDVDCTRLKSTLDGLGFKVRVHKDLKYDDVMKAFKDLASEDHSQHDCVLVAVLTHGGRGELHAKDFTYPACRGQKVDPGVVMADTVDAPTARTHYTIPNSADIIVANSTADGYYAWRNPKEGSWYVKMLCEELEKHSGTRDLATILTFVSRRVAIECESVVPDNPAMNQKKQIPCVINMLTRLVYLKVKPPLHQHVTLV